VYDAGNLSGPFRVVEYHDPQEANNGCGEEDEVERRDLHVGRVISA
jgi:hypothetical protein